MIRIFYNPKQLELIFSVAALLLAKCEEEYIFFMPVDTKKLMYYGPEELTSDELLSNYNNGCKAIENADDKIILLNIHPSNKEENIIVSQFYDHYSEQIMFWLDNSTWDKELLFYLKDNKKIIIDKELTCMQLLQQVGFLSPDDWLKAEMATIKVDMRNSLASRYIRANIVCQVIGDNLSQRHDMESMIFCAAVDELMTAQENENISLFFNLFFEMLEASRWAKKNFSTNNPIFKQAKRMGRKVGYLYLDEINNYYDINDILEYGSKKYPWLCVIEFSLNGINQIAIHSQKIQLPEIIEEYKKDAKQDLSNYQILQLINAEILK